MLRQVMGLNEEHISKLTDAQKKQVEMIRQWAKSHNYQL
jgi:hypothetical protein